MFIYYHTYDYNEYISTSVELQFNLREMAQLTVERRKFVAEVMIEHGSVFKTIRRFQERNGIRLHKRTVQTNYAKW